MAFKRFLLFFRYLIMIEQPWVANSLKVRLMKYVTHHTIY
jgi:hypothetical protein